MENYSQSFKNEWKINGSRVLVSTQIPQFWDTGWGLRYYIYTETGDQTGKVAQCPKIC